MVFYVGQTFEKKYPIEAAIWCNKTGNTIIEYSENPKIYEIVEANKPSPDEEEKKFEKEFFNTSLGYVRRKVSMKTGETKDFLADILPVLEVGVQILTYDKELKQYKKQVTEAFIGECKQQILKDFYGV